MGYTIAELKEKIVSRYPEIEKNGIIMGLSFNEDRNVYFISLGIGPSTFATHLQKSDTDAFMSGGGFLFLGSQIEHWLKNSSGKKKT